MSDAKPVRASKRTQFWNERIADARTDRERANVWHDACRTLAMQAEKNGHPEVWAELVQTLHDFYRRHQA